MKGLYKGIKAYLSAFGLIRKYRLWSSLILPGVLSVAIFFVVVGGGLFALYPFASKLATLVGWEGIKWIVEAVVFVLFVFIGVLFYRYLVLIFLGPFLGKVSEKLETEIYGPAGAGGGPIDGGGVWRAISLALRNLFYEIGFTLATYLLNFIPPAIPAIPFMVFTIESYYAGFGLMDLVLERKNMTKAQTIDFVRKHKGLALGLGLPFMAMNFIPIVGWFLGPTLGTVAATATTLEALRAAQGQPTAA